MTTLAESFIESYQRSGGRVSGSRLRFYLPCALARLGAIHLVRGVSAQVVERLWGLAGGFVSRRTPPFAALRTGLGELG